MLVSLRENLLHTFFYLLWAKARGRDRAETIRIPETVVLSHARVIDWFFTSKDGQIKKKSRQKLNSQLVMDQFANRAHKNKSDAFSVLIQRDPELEEGASATHLNAEGTRRFLTEGAASGTLQHFIEPKSESNVIHNLEIVCSWTPNVFYVERRQNINPLTKDKIELTDRTTLQETSKFVKVSPLVCGRATAALEGVCQLVAQHVESVYSVRVTGLSVHCKIDQNDDIWVLYASSFKAQTLSSPPKLLSVTLAASKPSRTNANTSINGNSSAASCTSPARSITGRSSSVPSSVATAVETCTVCKREARSGSMTSVPKRHVIFPLALISFFASMPPGSRFSDETLAGGDVRLVPEFVKIIHPRISLAQYNAERRTEEWQSELVPLCNHCASGLHTVISELKVGKRGEIVVPGDSPQKPLQPVAVASSASARSAPVSAPERLEPHRRQCNDEPRCEALPAQPSSTRRTLPPLSHSSRGSGSIPRRAASSLY
jgi:hypothetical protein